jgi:hypothetical protein
MREQILKWSIHDSVEGDLDRSLDDGGRRDQVWRGHRNSSIGDAVLWQRTQFAVAGAAIPANVGVNPSLTNAALAERAMTFVEPKTGAVVAAPIALTNRPPAVAPPHSRQ